MATNSFEINLSRRFQPDNIIGRQRDFDAFATLVETRNAFATLKMNAAIKIQLDGLHRALRHFQVEFFHIRSLEGTSINPV